MLVRPSVAGFRGRENMNRRPQFQCSGSVVDRATVRILTPTGAVLNRRGPVLKLTAADCYKVVAVSSGKLAQIPPERTPLPFVPLTLGVSKHIRQFYFQS